MKQLCSGCKCVIPIEQFEAKRDGTLKVTCKSCCAKRKNRGTYVAPKPYKPVFRFDDHLATWVKMNTRKPMQGLKRELTGYGLTVVRECNNEEYAIEMSYRMRKRTSPVYGHPSVGYLGETL